MAACNGAPFTVETVSHRAEIELVGLISRPALNLLIYQGSEREEEENGPLIHSATFCFLFLFLIHI